MGQGPGGTSGGARRGLIAAVARRDTATAALRALASVAHADGRVHPLERELLESLRAQLGIAPRAASRPISPAELAAAVRGEPARRAILGLAVLMVLIDGDVDPRERALVRELARALEIDDENVAQLERYAEGSLAPLRRNLLRRFMATERLGLVARRRGLGGLARVARAALRREDPALARRYRGLEYLRAGTLGREYWRFMRAQGFPLPGERGALPEPTVFHDCNHVVAGYGTDPEGEAEMSAFHAGTRRRDPMAMLLIAMMQLHLGVRVLPIAAPTRLRVPPARLVAAYVRGTHVVEDLTGTWEPERDFDVPVAALRRRFGIPPAEGGPCAR